MSTVSLMFIVTFALAHEAFAGSLGHRMEGGFTEQSAPDARIKAMVMELKPAIEKVIGPFTSMEVLSYRTQVVAGINYEFMVRVKRTGTNESSRVKVRAFVPLRGKSLQLRDAIVAPDNVTPRRSRPRGPA